MKNHDIITVTVMVKHETGRAYLVNDLKGKGVWIPKSQCELDGVEMQLPEWLAVEKGIV